MFYESQNKFTAAINLFYQSNLETKPISFYPRHSTASAASSESTFPNQLLLFLVERRLASPLAMMEHFSVVIQCQEPAESLSSLDVDSEATEGLGQVSLAAQLQGLVVNRNQFESHITFPVTNDSIFSQWNVSILSQVSLKTLSEHRSDEKTQEFNKFSQRTKLHDVEYLNKILLSI